MSHKLKGLTGFLMSGVYILKMSLMFILDMPLADSESSTVTAWMISLYKKVKCIKVEGNILPKYRWREEVHAKSTNVIIKHNSRYLKW